MTYDNIKSHKKTGFHPLFRRHIFGKTTAFLGLKKLLVLLQPVKIVYIYIYIYIYIYEASVKKAKYF